MSIATRARSRPVFSSDVNGSSNINSSVSFPNLAHHQPMSSTRKATIDRIGHKSLHGLSSLILLCTAVIGACSNNQSQMQSGTSGSSPPAVLSMEEFLRIGDEAAGDTVFFASIDNIAVNSRGQMFIEERGPAAIRAFDSDGSYLADVGAVGNGPGEYSDPLVGGVLIGPADSVYVLNTWRGKRLTIYGPDQFEFVRSVSIPPYPVEQGNREENFRILGAVGEGYIAQLRLVPSRLLETAHRETSEVIRMVNLDGSYGPVVTTGPGYEGVVTLREFAQLPQKIPFPDPIPFGRSMNWGLGLDGMLFSGWNDSINIAVMSIDVPEERHISLTHDPIPISNAEMEDWLSHFGPETKAKFSERGLHTTKPAYEELLVDDDNHVWLELSATQDSSDVEWIVLDMDSRVVGKVILPFDARLKAVRGGRVYAIETKGGMPTVAVYELNV